MGPVYRTLASYEPLIYIALAIGVIVGAIYILYLQFVRREILLSELSHRVKNSLALAVSLLSVQSHKVTDEVAREQVLECAGEKFVFAWGAGAKGASFLNIAASGNVESIVDINPDKQGRHIRPLLRVAAKLSKQQADYIGVPVSGPYKSEHYRY